jgi:hypothetical protein
VSAEDIMTAQLSACILDIKDAADGMAMAVAALLKSEPIPPIQFFG